MYLFLNSEPKLGKSKEFNNQGLKVNRNLNLNVIFFFCHQKTIKNRQALHEIIRALSLSINFAERSFKPVYPTMVVKSFKFMENYNYSQVKILTLDIFTHIFTSSPPQPLLTYTLAVSGDHDLEY